MFAGRFITDWMMNISQHLSNKKGEPFSCIFDVQEYLNQSSNFSIETFIYDNVFQSTPNAKVCIFQRENTKVNFIIFADQWVIIHKRKLNHPCTCISYTASECDYNQSQNLDSWTYCNCLNFCSNFTLQNIWTKKCNVKSKLAVV